MLLIPLRGMRSDRVGGELARHLLDLALLVGEVELAHRGSFGLRVAGALAPAEARCSPLIAPRPGASCRTRSAKRRLARLMVLRSYQRGAGRPRSQAIASMSVPWAEGTSGIAVRSG